MMVSKFPDTNVTFINLDDLWDPEILESDTMIQLISFFDKEYYDPRCSWLTYMMDEDRMIADEELDPLLEMIGQKSTRMDISYYFAYLNCHCYALFLAKYLQCKFPKENWRVVYINDHYIVMKLDDILAGRNIVYDILAHIFIKEGIQNCPYDIRNKKFIHRSVDRQYVMIKNNEYDDYPKLNQ